VDDDGETAIERRLLRQIGDVFALDAVEPNSPLHRTQFADDAFEQR
jgi:hypothetical protein